MDKGLTENNNIKKINKGTYIFKEGTPANKVYQIKKGHVSLISTNDYENTLIESIKTTGDYIGYSEIIANKNHNQSAQCLDDVLVHEIDKQQFIIQLSENSDFNKLFIEMINKELEQKKKQALCFAYCSVKKRILDALLKLDKKFNTKEVYPFFIEVKRKDIASLSGTVKETVIRTLKTLSDDGLIDLKRNGVIILNRATIEQLVHSKVI